MRLKKIEEAKQKDAKEAQLEKQKEMMKGGSKKKDDEPEGKLRMGQVQTLPDEIDECIKFMQTTDYGVQDLDILVELSK